MSPAKNSDPRVDAYIAKSAEFARPILEHIRKLIHKACPGAQETMKWSFPVFDYNGAILCNMAGFKQHCSLGFWKAPLMKDPEGILHVKDRKAMGHFDRITSLTDLPSDKIMISYIKQAATLNEADSKGVIPKVARTKAAPKAELPIPPGLAAALKKNKAARQAFDGFPPSHRREYISWILEAKTEETRERRIEKALEQIEEKKSLNWKYMKK
jgi:uncharacterized protein YdeI (YjbR/CyaY-like superfamily)